MEHPLQIPPGASGKGLEVEVGTVVEVLFLPKNVWLAPRQFLPLFLLVLAACSSTPVTSSLVAPSSSAPASLPSSAAVTVSASSAPEKLVVPSPQVKKMAVEFDVFLSEKLGEKQAAALIAQCTKDASKNPFCYAILNKENFENRQRARPEKKTRPARVNPEFRGEKISNWSDLREDTLNNLVRTYQRLGTERIHLSQKVAMAETTCPNNVAIAVAARLEDLLPDQAKASEIGALYEKGGECITDPDERENILTRAGLFFYADKDFTRAAVVWRRSSSIVDAKSPRSLFWLYRVELALGNKSAADSALKKLKERFPFSFHTVIARLREGHDPDDILTQTSPTEMRRTKQSSVNSLVESAEILIAASLNKSAAKVLDWAISESSEADPEFRLYLAQLKSNAQETHNSIFLLSKVLVENPGLTSRKTLELYFPKAYLSLFEKHSGALDPWLLLSVARQESAFDAKAISSARAKGLLQVVAKRARYAKDRKDLLDPETNIKEGAKMFAAFLEQNDRRIHYALSAYNAGPVRINTWVRRYPTADPILFTDMIPFKETRAYVALILRNYYWYRRIHSPGPNRLPWVNTNDGDRSVWLGTPSLATTKAD